MACMHAADTNTVWLVMELIRGGSLDEAISLSGPLPEKEAACTCRDLLEARDTRVEMRGNAHVMCLRVELS
jgi:serine/threonine protein kinase